MSKHTKQRVIDADGHVVEPLGMWTQYLEEAYRERAPRFLPDENGRIIQLLGDTPTGSLAVTLTQNSSRRSMEEVSREGGWNAKVRLIDMDQEDIEVAVLFPSMAFFACEASDPGLDAAMCRAYNNWLANYCSTAPERLYGVALLPLRDVETSVRELERATQKLGFRGAFVRPNPYGGRPIHHPAYERFWDCAQSLGVAITIHEGLSDSLPTLGRDRFANPAALHVLSHPFEQMAACAGLILTGVMERYPELRFAFLESGAGWLPYWLERLDGHFETWRKLLPAIQRPPREYFQRQCFVSCEPDEAGIDHVVAQVGDDCIVWASDYPHPDSHFPGTMDLTMESLADLSQDSRRKVLGSNAQRLFGLPG